REASSLHVPRPPLRSGLLLYLREEASRPRRGSAPLRAAIARGLCGWVESGYLGRMLPVVGTGSAVMECLMKRILPLAAVLAAGTFPVAAMAAPACADLVVVDAHIRTL